MTSNKRTESSPNRSRPFRAALCPPEGEPEPSAQEPLSYVHLENLDREGLVQWLESWGHQWPGRLLDIYGVDLVVRELVRLVGPYGDRAVDRHPGRLVVNVRRAAKSTPKSSALETPLESPEPRNMFPPVSDDL